MASALPPILAQIKRTKEEEVAALLAQCGIAALRRDAEARLRADPPRPFRESVTKAGKRSLPNVIAEIKKASPSAGIMRPDFYPSALAAAYERGGAAAISCLTDRTYFHGDLGHLREARRSSGLPVLRKDFLIHEAQIYEATAAGADAILLIARILEQAALRNFIALSKELGLAALVEVHDAAEVEKALHAGADLIGVNNRNLDTFAVDTTNAPRLRCLIPPHIPMVAESGIRTHSDLRRLAAAGIAAALIGEALMKQPDVEAALRSLLQGDSL